MTMMAMLRASPTHTTTSATTTTVPTTTVTMATRTVEVTATTVTARTGAATTTEIDIKISMMMIVTARLIIRGQCQETWLGMTVLSLIIPQQLDFHRFET